MKSKKTELDVSLQAKQNPGARSSRRQSKQVFSSQLVSLQYEDSETEDEEEEEVICREGGDIGLETETEIITLVPIVSF